MNQIPPRVSGLASVIVPSYNKAKYIRATLDSIAEQDYPDIEVVVVDDASSDNSLEIVHEWVRTSGLPSRILVHKTNQGICRSLNDAMTVARGEFVAALAADDLYLPHKISRHVAMMQEDPKAAFVYGDARIVDGSDKTLVESYTNRFAGGLGYSGDAFHELLLRDFIPALTVTMRGAALDRVGPYDEQLPYEDYDMWLRLARVGSLLYSGSIDAVYRDVPGSLTKELGPNKYVGHLRILGKYRGIPGLDSEALDVIAVREARKFAYVTSPQRGLTYGAALVKGASIYGGPAFALKTGVSQVRAALRTRLTRVTATVASIDDSSRIGYGDLFASSQPVCAFPQALNAPPTEHQQVRSMNVRWHRLRDGVVDQSSSFINQGSKVYLQSQLFDLIPDGANFSSSFCEQTGEKAVVYAKSVGESLDRGIAVVGLGSLNWYHWLVEVLPKAIMAQSLPEEFADWPLVVPGEVANIPQLRETLERCQGTRRIRFLPNSPVRIRDLIWIDSPSVMPFNLNYGWPKAGNCYHHREAIQSVVEVLTDGLTPDLEKVPDRVMLTRSQKRRLYNQDDVVAMARNLGFTTVDTEQLSFCEQVALFRGADVVAGPTGAAWTNILFAGGESDGLIWLPEKIRQFNCFANLAEQSGFRLHHYFYPTDATELNHFHSAAYSLDVAALEKALVGVLSSRSA